MTDQLTVVIGCRNREPDRIKRCLDSLERQTWRSFQVVFVDYGSDKNASAEARALVEQYAFCEFINNDTRGYPWNRSHALNSGARRAQTPFIMTTDVDMVFPQDFMAVVMSNAEENKVLTCSTQLMPENFTDWENIENYTGKYKVTTEDGLGGCQFVATNIYKDLRGFDEYYRYWGREDKDFHERLLASGLQPQWLSDQTTMFHQWHPPQTSRTAGFMPDSVWNRMQLHYLSHQNQLNRNDENWGQIVTTEHRPIFEYLDLDQYKLLDKENITLFDEAPDDIRSIGKLTNTLRDLQPGQVLAVNHSFFPKPGPRARSLSEYANYALAKMGKDMRVKVGRNLVHSFLVDFIDHSGGRIRDYYLDFPIQNGFSLLLMSDEPHKSPAVQ